LASFPIQATTGDLFDVEQKSFKGPSQRSPYLSIVRPIVSVCSTFLSQQGNQVGRKFQIKSTLGAIKLNLSVALNPLLRNHRS